MTSRRDRASANARSVDSEVSGRPARAKGPASHKLSLSLVAIMVAAAAGVYFGRSSGTTGLLPPENPVANIPAVSSDFLTSINAARASEGVGPLAVSSSTLSALPIPEQVFVVLNEERIGRGLPPIESMSAQLNVAAQQDANAGTDLSSPPTSLSGGSAVAWGGAIWAGNVSSVVEADYFWMYDDGWGGTASETSNEMCSPSAPSECWGHRDIILHTFSSCGTEAPTLTMGAAFASAYPGGSIATIIEGTCGEGPSDITLNWSQVSAEVLTPRVVAIAALPDGLGYWEVTANGGVAAYGQAVAYGSMSGHVLNAPVVGIASTPSGAGYWLVAADGGIFSFGNAAYFGSTGSLHLVAPITGITSTKDGQGYWLVAADGGIFSFGDAPFFGSMGGRALNQRVVGMAADLTTGGYWLVAADGGVFSFGAPFFGSTGSLHLAQPIVGMAALSNGLGYRFEAADGGVFCFGQAGFAGSMGGQRLVAPVVGMAADTPTGGYWLAAADGGIFSFGGAPFYGSGA
jgi:hypothetical protein